LALFIGVLSELDLVWRLRHRDLARTVDYLRFFLVVSSQRIVSVACPIELFVLFFCVVEFLLFKVFFVGILGLLLIRVAFCAGVSLIGDLFRLFERSLRLPLSLGRYLGLTGRDVDLGDQCATVF
jgi:hypothetical protein